MVLLLVFCVGLVAQDQVVSPASEPVILLTAYGPFAGRGVNGSQTLAESLDGQRISGHRVQVAVLPVTWGTPQAQLPGLIARHDPVLVLGLGEGHPGRVAVELKGVNAQHGADDKGQWPATVAIEAGGPAHRDSRIRFEATWFAGSPLPVVASHDAGRYLCNSLLYSALASPVDDVAFIHLPPQGTVPDGTYLAVLQPILRRLIQENLP